MVWRDGGGEARFESGALDEDAFQFRAPAPAAGSAQGGAWLLINTAQDQAPAEPCDGTADAAQRLAAIEERLDALDGAATAPEQGVDSLEGAPSVELWLRALDDLAARLADLAGSAAPDDAATLAELAAEIDALREDFAASRDAEACLPEDGEGDASAPAVSSAPASAGLEPGGSVGFFRDVAAQSVELGAFETAAAASSLDVTVAPDDAPPPRSTFSAASELAAIEARRAAIDASAETAERLAIFGDSPWSEPALDLWLEDLDQLERRLDGVAAQAGPEFAAPIDAVAAALAALRVELEGLRGGPAFTVADFDGAGQVVFLIDDGWSEIYQGPGETPVWEHDYYDADDDARGDGLFGATMLEVVRAEAPGVAFAVAKVFSDDGFDGGEFALYEQALADAAALDAAWDAAGGLNIAATLIGVGTPEVLTEPETGDPFGVSDDFAALSARNIANIATSGDLRFNFFDADGVNYPAADPSVVAVSATTAAGAAASDSQRDPVLTDIFAWGYDRPVTDEFGFTAVISGTDLAAAAVAGMVARLQQAADAVLGEALTDAELVAILQASGAAVVEGVDDVSPAPAGYVEADGDAAVGYFLLNADIFV